MILTKRNLFMTGGTAVLGAALVAVPSHCARSQEQSSADGQTEKKTEECQTRLEQLQTRLAEQLARQQERMSERLAGQEARLAERLQARALQAQYRAADAAAFGQGPEVRGSVRINGDDDGPTVLIAGEGSSWLGVESQEINADKAKELKLPAERGVLLGKILPDSPAAKAGLKENDVITEINGQRVEGEAQFRRMIHEIPAGRTALFTVWRDGRAQSIEVTLGKSEERGNVWFNSAPNAYSFELPKVEMPDLEVLPPGNFGVLDMLAGGRPRLGIDAEDLSGQFGAYFGAPDGEGVLVREVNSGSPAEKAGVKSGDVITALNGERIRSLGDLREKLAGNRDQKTVKLGVLRNKSEVSITVELPPPPSKSTHAITHRTNI
jgi:serine protease Do